MRQLVWIAVAALFSSSWMHAQAPAMAKTPTTENAGRQELFDYLNGVSAKETALRRTAVAKVHTRAEAEERQREVRRKVLALIGGLPEKTPLNARVLGSTHIDSFRIEKVVFDSQPNFPVTALFYLPDAHAGKLPAIVVAPGHGATGKAGDYATAATLARNGFAVLSYDPIGQGERLQYPDPAHAGQSLASRPTGEHGEAGLQPTLIGDAVARYFAWDGMRAVDYLQSRPEVDAERIGAFGCSGGGAMTALLGALDTRVKAIGTACFITSFDTLLATIGAQDAEQSIPGFLAAGLDFPDWVELAAPRHYAIIGTVSDMFPWKGLLASATEARRFYALFDASAAGTGSGAGVPSTPTGPTLNPDTGNAIPATAPLQVIAGIGGHGNLRPIFSQIVSFFLVNLAHSDASPNVPPAPPAGTRPPDEAAALPTGTLQVTATGQVATSFPGSETVQTLNLKHAVIKLPGHRRAMTVVELQIAVREVTHATVRPGDFAEMRKPGGPGLDLPSSKVSVTVPAKLQPADQARRVERIMLHEADGYDLPALFVGQVGGVGDKPCPGTLLVLPEFVESPDGPPVAGIVDRMLKTGPCVLAVTPRPSPGGTEEAKSPILGPFYLTELRAEIAGKTILGMRVDDVVTATDYLAHRVAKYPLDKGESEVGLRAEAEGHMGLVLMHAAVLDGRLKHIRLDHEPRNYADMLKSPMPLDAPQDILPGVLLHYDVPDLVQSLGTRLTAGEMAAK